MTTKAQVESAYREMECVKDEAMAARIDLGIEPGKKFSDSTYGPLAKVASAFNSAMDAYEKENPLPYWKKYTFSFTGGPESAYLAIWNWMADRTMEKVMPA